MQPIENISLGMLEMPEPDATVQDRIKYLISFSRKTQAQFSKLLGVDPSSLSKVLSQKMPVAESFINRIVVNLGVSKAWLNNGEGVPFPRREGLQAVDAPAPINRAVKGAPVYDIDVTAGTTPLSQAFTREHIIGYLDMPGINPKFPLVRVSGDSMTPRVPNGSYISIRQINDPSVIFWGAMYLVELEDYRMVKYVRRHNDPKKIILHSENPAYDDMEIKRDSIVKLFLVEGIVNYEFMC